MPPPLRPVASALAKNVFPRVGADAPGNMLWRTRLIRQALRPLIAQRPPVGIGMEAWGGAHAGASRFRAHGHAVTRRAPLECPRIIYTDLDGSFCKDPDAPPWMHVEHSLERRWAVGEKS